MVVKRFFVFLHTVKGVATISPPLYLNLNKLKMLRNALNLSFLGYDLRKVLGSKRTQWAWHHVIVTLDAIVRNFPRSFPAKEAAVCLAGMVTLPWWL